MPTIRNTRGCWGYERFAEGYFGVGESGLDIYSVAITDALANALLQNPLSTIRYSVRAVIGGVTFTSIRDARVTGSGDGSSQCRLSLIGSPTLAINASAVVYLDLVLGATSAALSLYSGTVSSVNPTDAGNVLAVELNAGYAGSAWTSVADGVRMSGAFSSQFNVPLDALISAHQAPAPNPIGSLTMNRYQVNDDDELVEELSLTVTDSRYPDGQDVRAELPADASVAWSTEMAQYVDTYNAGTVKITTPIMPLIAVGSAATVVGVTGISGTLWVRTFEHVIDQSGAKSTIELAYA